MVPVDSAFGLPSDYTQQWSPYSAYDSSSPMQHFEAATTNWDLFVAGSPAGPSASLVDEGQSVPVYGQKAPQLQAYTFDGQMVKSEPATLLDCLKTTTPSQHQHQDQQYQIYQQTQQKQLHIEEARVKMEETCRLAQQIAYSDVMAACRALRISPGKRFLTFDSRRGLCSLCPLGTSHRSGFCFCLFFGCVCYFPSLCRTPAIFSGSLAYKEKGGETGRGRAREGEREGGREKEVDK